MAFLPVTREEMLERGWEQPDFVYICGDAYVDHPSFGAAIICRVLESHGYKVCFIAQPDWKTTEDFTRFGEPRLGFLVSAGNIDSMVNHYTVAKKPRKKDYYTPGGEMGKRPDRATIVYCNKLREVYKKTPIIIGGVEASLRRLSHYDYWDNKVRRSILLDSGADLLLFGMGEHQIIEMADALDSGIPINELTFLRGSVYKTKDISRAVDYIVLPKYKEVQKDKDKYNESFLIQYQNTDAVLGKTLIEEYDEWTVVQNPPSPPLRTPELDKVYALNFERNYHPMYIEKGGVPAIEEVKFSLVSNRGCFGNCNFCALAFHQGRVVTARSHNSLIAEAEKITWDPDFKGYIHDVGGPTANFRRPACDKQIKHGLCKGKKCLAPKPCSQLVSNHEEYLEMLRTLRKLPKVKKVFIRSGIRFDYLLEDKDKTFFRELVEYHTSGQLKVAPEHCSASVLDYMGKPHIEAYVKFAREYFAINKKIGKEQYLVPYLMSSHPGSTLDDAIELALFLKKEHIKPEQVQDFYPTPGTISTCMFYTGLDPYTLKEVYVAKDPHDKALQRALLQSYNPKNKALVEEALKKARRFDLIGNGEKCLIKGSFQQTSSVRNTRKPVKNNGKKKKK